MAAEPVGSSPSAGPGRRLPGPCLPPGAPSPRPAPGSRDRRGSAGERPAAQVGRERLSPNRSGKTQPGPAGRPGPGRPGKAGPGPARKPSPDRPWGKTEPRSTGEASPERLRNRAWTGRPSPSLDRLAKARARAGGERPEARIGQRIDPGFSRDRAGLQPAGNVLGPVGRQCPRSGRLRE